MSQSFHNEKLLLLYFETFMRVIRIGPNYVDEGGRFYKSFNRLLQRSVQFHLV